MKKKNKDMMRRLILTRLYDFLQDQYVIFYPRDNFLNGEFSMHDLDALLAFKGDSELEELRRALDRLEDGSFGICISCKIPIDQEILDHDPAQRICTACEQKFLHMPPSYHYAHHISA